jgi:acyl carrier protein
MKTEREIIDHIKQDLLLDRLELADTGLTFEDISDDHLLLDSAGLGLDSVEALDLLVGVEKTYGFQIAAIDKDLIEKACHSVRSLAAFVLERVAPTQPAGQLQEVV